MRGRRHQRARHRQHLLLAARERAGELLAPLLAGGESARTCARCPRRCRRSRRAGRRRPAGSPHGHLREHQPVLRHQREAARDDARAARPAISSPSRRIGAAPGLAGCRRWYHQRGLAGAVGAEQAGDAALAGGERDALQRLDLAVGGGDVVDLEHRADLSRSPVPSRPRAPAGSAWTSAGVPSAIFWPKLSTAMRSVTAITSSM